MEGHILAAEVHLHTHPPLVQSSLLQHSSSMVEQRLGICLGYRNMNHKVLRLIWIGLDCVTNGQPLLVDS